MASQKHRRINKICTNQEFDENQYIDYLIEKYKKIYNVED